jgi:hypothetical protein
MHTKKSYTEWYFFFIRLFIFQNAESDSDIWDDTALIKAYDNAVNVMKVSQIKYSQ